MATVDKNFKVKHGIIVAEGGTFGGQVFVAPPTLGDHAATKYYVDSLVSKPVIPISQTPPENPQAGELWYDTLTTRLHIFYNQSWSAIANLQDAETLQDHIHDTAIDGTGRIVSIFVDAGFYNNAGDFVAAGTYDFSVWDEVWDGGIAVDNFN